MTVVLEFAHITVPLGVFTPHLLPCEISEANFFGNFNGFLPDSRRLSLHFDRFSVIFNLSQSDSISFSQF